MRDLRGAVAIVNGIDDLKNLQKANLDIAEQCLVQVSRTFKMCGLTVIHRPTLICKAL